MNPLDVLKSNLSTKCYQNGLLLGAGTVGGIWVVSYLVKNKGLNLAYAPNILRAPLKALGLQIEPKSTIL